MNDGREEERRWCVVSVPISNVVRWMQSGHAISMQAEGLPPDAQLVRWYHRFETDSICFVFNHPSFPVSEPGCEIPMLSDVHDFTVYDTRETLELKAYIESKHNGYNEADRELGWPRPATHLQALKELIEEKESIDG